MMAMVYGGYRETEDISDWRFDLAIGERIRRRLPTTIKVEQTTYAPELEQVTYLASSERGLRFDLGEKVLLPTIERFLQSKPTEYVLLIVPGNSTGSSLWVVNGLKARSFDRVRASISLVLFDAKTGKVVRDQSRLGWCQSIAFDFDARNIREELNRKREKVESLWGECIDTELDLFFRGLTFVR